MKPENQETAASTDIDIIRDDTDILTVRPVLSTFQIGLLSGR